MGGGGGQQGGGDMMAALSRMMNYNSGPSTIGTSASPGGQPIGGIDIPPADMHDPFGGPQWASQGYDPGMSAWGNPWSNFNSIAPWGNTPPSGTLGAGQGPTQIPTFFDPNGYPFAVPNVAPGSDFNTHVFTHTPQKKQN